MLLGGGAGALLCGILVAAAVSIGPLLGIGWPGGDANGTGTPEAVRLPAIPDTPTPAAEAEAARARAGRTPRIVDAVAQPTRVVRPTAPGSRQPQSQAAPSLTGRAHQPTTSSRIVTPPSTTDAPSVPAPEAPAPAVAAAAAAIPATPVTPVRTGKALGLRVASVGVEKDAQGAPELRMSLTIDRGTTANAPVPDQVTVRLHPRLPDDLSQAAALTLRAHVDVVDAPANDGPSDSAGTRAVQVPGMQMRVRMTLEPAEPAAPATTPTVADAGDGDGQSNVIALSVPLAAFSDEDDPAPTPAPADPAAPAPAPAEQTEIRLDLSAPADADATHPESETANVAAPDTTVEHGDDTPDVPVTVVVDPAPAPAPPADPAPAPQPVAPPPAEPQPADPPADTQPANPTPPAYPNSGGDTTVTAAAATPPADPAASSEATPPADAAAPAAASPAAGS